MRTFPRPALALAFIGFGIIGCREMPPTFAPTPLDTGTALVDFWAGGPIGLSSGEQGQFRAKAIFANRGEVIVTHQTAWSSSEPSVLTVGPDGVAVAHAPGTATVSATYENRTVATPVVIMPAGTFRLEVDVWGLYDVLFPGKRPVSATVELTAGVGAGQRASQIYVDDFPFYVLYGVSGLVTIAISAPGFATQTVDLTVQSHMRHEIVLSPVPVPPEPPEN